MDEDRKTFWKSREKHCKRCKKYFIVSYPTLYAYKKGKDFYCGWNCYNEEVNKKGGGGK